MPEDRYNFVLNSVLQDMDEALAEEDYKEASNILQDIERDFPPLSILMHDGTALTTPCWTSINRALAQSHLPTETMRDNASGYLPTQAVHDNASGHLPQASATRQDVFDIRHCSLCSREVEEQQALFCTQGECGHNPFTFCSANCYNIVHPKRLHNHDLNLIIQQVDTALFMQHQEDAQRCWKIIARYFYPLSVLRTDSLAVSPRIEETQYVRRDMPLEAARLYRQLQGRG